MGILSGPAGETFKGYPLIIISISRVHFPVNVHFHQHLGVLAVHVVHIFYQFIILVVAGLPDLVNQALLYVGYRFLRHQDTALVPASSRVIGISAANSIVAIAVPVIPVAVSVVAVISVIIFLIWKCVVCYLCGQVDSSPYPALFSICIRRFIYGTDICSIVISTSSQLKKYMK